MYGGKTRIFSGSTEDTYVVQEIERLYLPEDELYDNEIWMTDPIGSLKNLTKASVGGTRGKLSCALGTILEQNRKMTLEEMLELVDVDTVGIIAKAVMPKYPRPIQYTTESLGLAVNPTEVSVKNFHNELSIQKATINCLSDDIVGAVETLITDSKRRDVQFEIVPHQSIASEIGEYFKRDELRITCRPWFGCHFLTTKSLYVGWPFGIMAVAAKELKCAQIPGSFYRPKIFIVCGEKPKISDKDFLKRVVEATKGILTDCSIVVPDVDTRMIGDLQRMIEASRILGAWRPPFERKDFYCFKNGRANIGSPD